MITNHTGLPEPIFRAASDDDYDRGESAISITSLIDSPRLEALKELHKHEITEDVADMANSLIGKAVHDLLGGDKHVLLQLADAVGGFLKTLDITHLKTAWNVWKFHCDSLNDHKRLFITVNGWVVSGQTDYYDPLTQTAWDWKSSKSVKPEYIAQLNCYRVLLEANGYPVSALKIALITKNWSPYDKAYLPNSIVAKDVEMWDYDDAVVYIEERVMAHQAARVVLPLCSDSDRWVEPNKYAVVKDGNNRAVRLFDTEEEAQNRADELSTTTGELHKVEDRPGDPTPKRCFVWSCRVNKWCEQAQGER